MYSTPARPPAIVTVQRRSPGWSLADGGECRPGKPRPVVARSIVFPGAAGAVETVSYGQPYHADQVVIALHGGPLNAWRLSFDPLLHALAANGVGVIAPNQRGSTHYGVSPCPGHPPGLGWPRPRRRLVHRPGSSLRPGRSAPRPIVLGTSYGAFLALLAAAADPDLWAGCVAFAPFLSGPRLYPEAGEATRTLIERLGGLTVPVIDGRPATSSNAVARSRRRC